MAFRKLFLLFTVGLILTLGLSFSAIAKKKASGDYIISGAGNLNAAINQAINDVNPDLNAGVFVKSMTSGDTLFAKNASKVFVPASILKIFTAESALLYLGADYRFTTNFLTDADSINNGVLNGNLYLVHSGDPSLTYIDLTDLMSQLKAKGIHTIKGNVFIDTTAYDQEIYGPGWLSNDIRFCYAAPISASIINHNCLIFQIAPGKAIGRRANIIEDRKNYIAGVQNEVVTKARGSRSCNIRLGVDESHKISLTGCMQKGHNAQGISTVIKDVINYNQSLMLNLFQRSGVQIQGNILLGVAPTHAAVIASHQSVPLRELITQMLKKSDNIIAGSLFKKMGEIYMHQPGSWENGSEAVTQILKQKIGVNAWRMSVLDGSGLSRDNLISPEQMMQVLNFAYHNNATNYDFISGLPIAGIDGTLKHRMKNIAGKVRAKTGTMSMSGVVALAGYAISKDKEPIAFVIIVNGHVGMGWRYKELENRIVTLLANYSRN